MPWHRCRSTTITYQSNSKPWTSNADNYSKQCSSTLHNMILGVKKRCFTWTYSPSKAQDWNFQAFSGSGVTSLTAYLEFLNFSSRNYLRVVFPASFTPVLNSISCVDMHYEGVKRLPVLDTHPPPPSSPQAKPVIQNTVTH